MNSDKTIWVINFFAGSASSGWGERHFYFAKHWKAHGYNVKIISSSYNHMFNTFPDVKETYTSETIDGIEFIWVKTPHYHAASIKRFYAMLYFAWKVYQYGNKSTSKPATVLVSSMPLFSIWPGIKFKKKWGAKLIFEIRDIWPLTLQLLGNKSASHPAVKFLSWFEKKGYEEADIIVSLLPDADKHIKRVIDKKFQFAYIPNGIDAANIKEENLDVEIRSAIPENKFIIGYTGTVGIANAMEYFAEAALLLHEQQQFHFVIVGDGYMLDSLKEKCSTLHNITFIDKIAKSKMQAIISLFDVCYIGWHKTELYKYGVSANKYFDYMLSGKPILVSSDNIVDPVSICGCGVIVEAESAEKIAEGIMRLYNLTAEERKVTGMKGNQYVLKEHSISELAKKYETLFKQ